MDECKPLPTGAADPASAVATAAPDSAPAAAAAATDSAATKAATAAADDDVEEVVDSRGPAAPPVAVQSDSVTACTLNQGLTRVHFSAERARFVEYDGSVGGVSDNKRLRLS